MPGGDRTGPTGAGPMTGRGAGYCRGYDVPGYANQGMGRGFGGGGGRAAGGAFRGGGRGWRHQYYATGIPGRARGQNADVSMRTASKAQAGFASESVAEELAALRDQVAVFKGVIEELQERVAELSGHDTSDGGSKRRE